MKNVKKGFFYKNNKNVKNVFYIYGLNKLESYTRISALGPVGHCTSHFKRAVCRPISCRPRVDVHKGEVGPARGVHPPEAMMHFAPLFQISPPIFEKFEDSAEKISDFHPPKFLMTFFFS